MLAILVYQPPPRPNPFSSHPVRGMRPRNVGHSNQAPRPKVSAWRPPPILAQEAQAGALWYASSVEVGVTTQANAQADQAVAAGETAEAGECWAPADRQANILPLPGVLSYYAGPGKATVAPTWARDRILRAARRVAEVSTRGVSVFASSSRQEREDSEDMSSAGQMDTFLAITGVDEVIKTVAKCWSSQFTHIACGYKRRYGQPLDSPMAVVVQAMAPAEVAGVLFTCDSRTGDSRRILITANHGLGDSVVSGKTDPDTVILERCTKSGDIKEGGGTELQPVKPAIEPKCCLSEERIRLLGKLAEEMESAFSGPRDVEWAFEGDTLYVLQARPVTSLYLPTDVELMHELDEGFRTSDECLTKANIGEVVNCAQSPLGSAIFTIGIIAGNKEENNERAKSFHNPYHDRFFVTTLGNVFFPASNDTFSMRGDGPLRKGLAYALRGGCMEDEDVSRLMAERAKLRFSRPTFFGVRKLLTELWNCEKLVKEGYKKYYDMKLPVTEGDDSCKRYSMEICQNLILLSRSVKIHAATNMTSVLANSFAFTMLAKFRGEWSDRVLS
ncbi:hypothetical protein MRX96_002914 [Rhipicephalus microplus]